MVSLLRPSVLAACLLACTAEGRWRPSNAQASEDLKIIKVLPLGLPVIGAPCLDPAAVVCNGSDRIENTSTNDDQPALLECSDGVWRVLGTCADRCSAQQQCSAGCTVTAEGHDCLCIGGPSSCSGDSRCEDHGTLEVTDENSGIETIECGDLCRLQGPESFSVGCGFDPEGSLARCLCAAVGDPCEEAWHGGICMGVDGAAQDIVRCDAGTWVVASCSVECGDPEALCTSESDGSGVCSCA